MLMRLTGRKRVMRSRLTGKQVVYHQTLHNYVYDHQAPPDLPTAINQINSDFLTQGYDAYCDSVTLVQGAITDTLQPSVWIASTSPLDPITVTSIVGIIKAILYTILLITIYFIVTAVKELVWGVPKQYYIPEAGITSPVSWEEYISYQNAHYWYVCSKDGAGFGDKSKYPNITDVPQTEVQAYQDHCSLAPDISPQPDFANLVGTIGIVIIVAVGLYFGSKIIEKI